MCTTVQFDDGEIENVLELKLWALVHGMRAAQFEAFSGETANDLCLCGTDTEGVLAATGVPFEWDPFGFRVRQQLTATP